MDDDAGRDQAPLTLQVLADLQAGLLDDDTAAALRRRIRDDPDAAAMLASLDKVRAALADLGRDAASAPEVPAAVTARIGAALRAQRDAPAHSARQAPRWQLVALVTGVGAALVGAAVGALMLTRPPAPTWSMGPTAERITVSRPATELPLPTSQITALLTQAPDWGPLADPGRRAACLSELGYAATTPVLGARPVDMDGRPGILMLLPAHSPGTVLALVVAPDCTAGHTGLLANTLLARP
ncbi:hypothetical protein A5724_10355 [Mycobacterium sp. ACS1612]|nr:hypothetical protein [Mycobacterium sp. ACS1612]OBF38128.1 hypothetical protein A5724_10355 [Mycobacterium sp. ACS1612]